MDRPVAPALVTQTQLDLLGSSLKVVFDIDDGAPQFSDLLRALDDPETAKKMLVQLAAMKRDC